LFTDNVEDEELGIFYSHLPYRGHLGGLNHRQKKSFGIITILDKPIVTTSDLTHLILLQQSTDNLTIIQTLIWLELPAILYYTIGGYTRLNQMVKWVSNHCFVGDKERSPLSTPKQLPLSSQKLMSPLSSFFILSFL